VQPVYYRDSTGVEPVNDFIDALPPERQEELDFKIGLLNRLTASDPPLPFPHSSQVDGQLRELRCHYRRDLYRILYQRSGNLFVLLHAIEKRTGAPPMLTSRSPRLVSRTSASAWTPSLGGRPARPAMMPPSGAYQK
jgi:phage-related protein